MGCQSKLYKVVTPPYKLVTPPYKVVTPPLQSCNPPLQSCNPPLQTCNPPYKLVTPLHVYNTLHIYSVIIRINFVNYYFLITTSLLAV